jgi:hypothetical protein
MALRETGLADEFTMAPPDNQKDLLRRERLLVRRESRVYTHLQTIRWKLKLVGESTAKLKS